jgi:hypothetical protein
MVKKEPAALGAHPALRAIRGVIEIADVEKLRLDPAHRDSKAELVFAKVTYLQTVMGKSKLNWPIVSSNSSDQGGQTVYQRTGLLVVGYYNDARRFESHLADLQAFVGRIAIPPGAIPPNSAPLVLASSAPVVNAAPPTPAPAISPPAAVPAPSASVSTPTVAGPVSAAAPVTAPNAPGAKSAVPSPAPAPTMAPAPTVASASKPAPAAVAPSNANR